MLDLKAVDRWMWHALGNVVLIFALVAGYWCFARKLQAVEAQREEARSLLDFREDDPVWRPGSVPWDGARRRWLTER